MKINKIIKIVPIIVTSSIFVGCGKDLGIKPYPKHLSLYQNTIDTNKEYWGMDLKDDIEEFQQFVENTFVDIDKHQNRYKLRYNNNIEEIDTKGINKQGVAITKKDKLTDMYEESIYGQYR